MTEIRVRGVYSTALTQTFATVVQPSKPIAERFDREFAFSPATVAIETTRDRQGVGLHGSPDAVEQVSSELESVGRDTFGWNASLPRGGIYAGRVTDTRASGAIIDCGSGTGFLPYSKTARHIEKGDCLRVQVREPRPPWRDGYPVLGTSIHAIGELATLVRGGTAETGEPELADILPVDPPSGWAIDWSNAADHANLDELAGVLKTLSEQANSIDSAFADASPPKEIAPDSYWMGEQTRWLWFGRESRFELDARRGEVVPTMAGHHRIKAGSNRASTAVDFVEAVSNEIGATVDEFPFEAVTEQFGPHIGDTVSIGHGKPDGRRIDLGTGEVTERDGDQLTVEREMTGGGRYDALETKKREGDIATTTFREGRWWYPTVYRGTDGESRGTYVNICTPLELFPDEIRYIDLYVDVIRTPDDEVSQVDEAELADAVASELVSEELARKAREVATAVERALS